MQVRHLSLRQAPSRLQVMLQTEYERKVLIAPSKGHHAEVSQCAS